MSAGPSDPRTTPGQPAPAAQSTGFSEVQQMQEREIARQKQLLDMLVEDARSGRVKDPEGRNARGRNDRRSPGGRSPGGRVGSQDSLRTNDDAAEATAAAEASDLPAADDAEAGTAIAGASSAVQGLRKTLTDDLDVEGEKIVRYHDLV